MTPGLKPVRRHRVLYVVLLVVAGLLAFYAYTCIRIVRQSALDEARPADVIVVFGAAEYNGRPSPVYRARLDHAYDLFEQRLAPIIITTGGAGKETRFTEGQVGRDYLAAKGLSDRHLIAETQGDNSAESAQRVATIMRANGMRTCIAVSDPYHLYRIKQMLQAFDVQVYTSPRPQVAPVTRWGRLQAVAREALSYILWRMHIT